MSRFIKIISVIMVVMIIMSCVACGNKIDDEHVHKYSWTVFSQPKCEENGVMKGVCTCGEQTYTEIDATGHNYKNGKCIICNEGGECEHEYVWETIIQPTCEQSGKMVGTCKCGHLIETELNALSHNYINGVCDKCQKPDPTGKVGYTWNDIFIKCRNYGFVENIFEIEDFVLGLRMTNLYVNGVGNLKAKFDKNDNIYNVNLGNVRKASSLTATNQDYITALSIGYDGVLAITYVGGITKRVGYIAEEYKNIYVDLSVIKYINLNTNNNLFVTYIDDSVRSIGKIPSKNLELVANNILYDDYGMIVGLLDYTVSYIKIDESINGVTITGIRSEVFEKAVNATTIYIPASVTNFGVAIFGSKAKLKTVRYGGTKQQWEQLSLGSSNSVIKNATIIYECES